MSALRKELSPSFMAAYNNWDANQDLSLLNDWAQRGTEHWYRVISELLKLNHEGVNENSLEEYIEGNRL